MIIFAALFLSLATVIVCGWPEVALHHPQPQHVFHLGSQHDASGFTCTDLTIPFSVHRTTDRLYNESRYSVEVLYAIKDFKNFVTNSYNISATYCVPQAHETDLGDAIQLLVHGATFNKLMWDWPYQPEKYSWTRRMLAEGYPTLAFDQIGEYKPSESKA